MTTAPQQPQIQLLDFGHGITIPAEWVMVIPGTHPVLVLRPLVIGVLARPGAVPEKNSGA
jgi:hypothetical protein